jgi:hypothetical protein
MVDSMGLRSHILPQFFPSHQNSHFFLDDVWLRLKSIWPLTPEFPISLVWTFVWAKCMSSFLASCFSPSHQNSESLLFEHFCGPSIRIHVWLHDSAPHTRIPNFSCLNICVGYVYELIFGFMIRPLTPDCQFCFIDHLCGLCVWVPIWLYDSAPHIWFRTCFSLIISMC